MTTGNSIRRHFIALSSCSRFCVRMNIFLLWFFLESGDNFVHSFIALLGRILLLCFRRSSYGPLLSKPITSCDRLVRKGLCSAPLVIELSTSLVVPLLFPRFLRKFASTFTLCCCRHRSSKSSSQFFLRSSLPLPCTIGFLAIRLHCWARHDRSIIITIIIERWRND